MKNSSRKTYSKLIFTLLLSVFNFVSIAADNNELNHEINKEENLLIDNELNQFLNIALNQLDRFEYSLGYLAILVQNQSSQFTNKSQILDYIHATRNIISGIKGSSFIVPQIKTIMLLQEINSFLCRNLQTALDSQCWRPVDLEDLVKRHQPSLSEDIYLDVLMQKIKARQVQNIINLGQIENKIERFGLTFSQKVIRNLEDLYARAQFYIEEHKLTPYLKYSAIGAAISVYAVYQSEYLAQKTAGTFLENKYIAKIFNNPVTRSLKSLIGSAPTYDINMLSPQEINDLNTLEYTGQLKDNPKYLYPVSNQNKLGYIGKTEQFVSSFAKTESTPSVLIPGAAFGWLSHEIIDDSKIGAFALFLSNNPMIRMTAITNFALQIKDSDRYRNFKYFSAKYLTNKYNSLRGKVNKQETKPTMTFNDVIGLEDQKKEFEVVVDYIINPDKFERTKLTPAKGYLMFGAPRTGKSYIARAICGEINARKKLLGKPESTSFISLDASLIMTYNFNDLMSYINSNAPCIVFIDEIDLLCLNRDSGKENKLLSQILTHMSGYFNGDQDTNQEANKQVIFIAATNNPQNLDSALLKSGRFSKTINFEYPHIDERIIFIKQELNKRSIDAISPQFVNDMAKELEGCSFEDLSLVITGAIQKASCEYSPVTEEHFKASIEGNIKSILPQIKALSDQEIATIATYQTGRALSTILLTPNIKISTITTKPINKKIDTRKAGNVVTTPTLQHGGIFTYKNNNLLNLKNDQDLILECQTLLAGHVAQELLLGSGCYTYRAEDQQAALTIAKQIALCGENYQEMTPDLQQDILRQAYAIKSECRAKIKALLSQHQTTLNALAQALQTKQHLSEKEIYEIINN